VAQNSRVTCDKMAGDRPGQLA